MKMTKTICLISRLPFECNYGTHEKFKSLYEDSAECKLRYNVQIFSDLNQYFGSLKTLLVLLG